MVRAKMATECRDAGMIGGSSTYFPGSGDQMLFRRRQAEEGRRNSVGGGAELREAAA